MNALLDPVALLGSHGPFGPYILPAMLLLVFVESGLLFPFLPGDSLLFTGGLLAIQPNGFAPLWVLLCLVPVAAVAGDQAGYFLGNRFAPHIERRGDGRLLKREHLRRTHDFFDRHGPVTVILCRFVPVVRTYAPLVAGMARMRYRTFLTYNVVGGLLWGAGVVALGALLGHVGFVRDHLEAIFLAIIATSLLPALVGVVKSRFGSRVTTPTS